MVEKHKGKAIHILYKAYKSPVPTTTDINQTSEKQVFANPPSSAKTKANSIH